MAHPLPPLGAMMLVWKGEEALSYDKQHRQLGQRGQGAVLYIHSEPPGAAREREIEIGDGTLRRTIVVGGLDVRDLVGKLFTVGGSVLMEGVEYLPKTESSGEGFLHGWRDVGGLRVRVIRGGCVADGDQIEPVGD